MSREAAPMLAGRTILLVEDEAFIAMDLEHWLQEAGARVIGPIPSLDEAREAAAAEPVDAAVLDIMLGRSEVFPAADILVARGVPIVFHSAHAEIERLRDSYPGAPLHPKPGDPNGIIRLLATLTTRKAP